MNEFEEILGKFAEDLLAYDARMDAAGAPPIRFVNKYIQKAKKQLEALQDISNTKAQIELIKYIDRFQQCSIAKSNPMLCSMHRTHSLIEMVEALELKLTNAEKEIQT